MFNSNGRFVWYELMTTDLGAARAFYGSVVGWQAVDAQMPGMEYWLFKAGERAIAGAMTLPADARAMGTPSNWCGYVEVADVDASATQVKALGGQVYVAPMDVPNVGRFAIIADPQGAAIALFKSANPSQDGPMDPNAPGGIGWHELYALDADKAFAFYSAVFGWQKKESMDMGEMGPYQMFGLGDATLGGMMNKPPMVPVACWSYYFNVGNIDEAVARVTAGGGQVVNGPTGIPGGGFIIQGMDPQGAMFALVGQR